jgi:hypothetical protein
MPSGDPKRKSLKRFLGSAREPELMARLASNDYTNLGLNDS